MTLVRSLLFVAASFTLAHAQASPAAEALFREGRTLIKTGKLEAGCNKLEASEKVESSVGTLLNLGDCKEKLGKTATAWAAFRKAEAMAKRAGDDQKRQAEAKRRAQKLEAELSSLVIQVGKSTPGVVIKRDGESLDAAVLNSPLPVDPGAHEIIAEAPGYKPFKTEVSIGKGGKRYVVIPTLEREPEKMTPPSAPPAIVVRNPETPSVVAVPAQRTVVVTDTWSGTRKAAVGVGIAGAVGIGLGAYFGSRANDLQAQSDAICPTTVCNDAEGLRLNDQAKDNALYANLSFIAGGAALATATVMWFVGAPEERTVLAPAIGSDHVGASLVGRF
jgi:hypothetical protein